MLARQHALIGSHPGLRRSGRRARLRSGPSRQRGLSLIELMISITLGLIILVALLAVFNQNSQSFRQTDAAAEMQDNARFAMEALSRDLSMAGFFGGIYNAGDVQTQAGSLTVDCGLSGAVWYSSFANRIEFANHTQTASSVFGCLGQTNTPVQANTDVVAIRHSAGQSRADMLSTAANVGLDDNTYYLQSNGTQATLVQTTALGTYTPGTSPLSSQPLNPPMSFYKYVPRVYFVRSFAHVVGDGIPALCRMELQQQAGGTMAPECLADGIENLQIQWGLDTNSNCIPDTYYPTTSNASTIVPTATLAAQAMTARIWLLVRALKPESGYIDTKTYTIGDFSYTPATSSTATPGLPPPNTFRRRVYTTTVQMRNPIGSNGPCPTAAGGTTTGGTTGGTR